MPDINLSPYDARQAAINRRRQLAAALQQQSMQPLQAPAVPGALISPLEGFAKLAQALVGNIAAGKAEKSQKELSAEMQADRQAKLAALLSGQQPDIAGAMSSGDPVVQQIAAALQGQQFTKQQQEAQQADAMSQLQTRQGFEQGQQATALGARASEFAAELAAKAAEAQRQREFEAAQNEAARRNQLAIAGIRETPAAPVPGRDVPYSPEVEAQRTRMQATRAATGRPVTSGDANRIADFNTSVSDIDVLNSVVGAGVTGTRAKLGAMAPNWLTELTGWGTDAKSRQAVIDRVKQVIGKALEGGVLRKEDEYKYEKILPTIYDVPQVVQAKLTGLKSAITQRRSTLLDSLDDAGYDVSQYRKRETAGPTSQTGPPVGTVINGFEFTGGNPNDQKNWKKK